MRAIKNNFTSPVRPLAAGTWLALFSMMILCLFALTANAGTTTLPIVVTGPAVQLGALTGGGWGGSQSPLSGTFVIGANGNVYAGTGYGSTTVQIVPGGADTTFLSIGGSAATMDNYGNLYFGAYYSNAIYKVPYNAAAGTYTGFTSAPTANCKGGTQDTAPCIFAPGVKTGGYADLAFDAQGDFFFASGTVPSTKNTIYECNLACIASANGTPTLLYTDSVAMGAMGIDPWGNIFFSDGANGNGNVTYLKELPFVSGAYAASPTTLLSYTNAVGYSNGVSGVAVASSGTVYFATNADGIFALPNTQSAGPNVAGVYMVSRVGGRAIAIDSKGNFYQMNYNGGDVISSIPANNVALAASAVGGTATTAIATIIDNAASCTPSLTLAVTEFGAPTTEFAAKVGSSCSTALGTGNGTFSAGVSLTGAATTATVTFTPSMAGERSAALTITDSANSATGTVTATGIGQGAVANLDPGVSTAFTTGFATPTSVIADVAGDLFVADPGAGEVFEIATGTTTLKSIGSFTTPVDLVLDANGNLYVADTGTNQIDEIVNTFSGANGGFTAGTQSVAVSNSATIGGLALNAPNGLAIGPDGVLYISDSKNTRVVTFNPVNGVLGLTQANSANGLRGPVGITVDASGNLYVADPTAGSVFLFNPASGFSTVTVTETSPVSEPVGVAVEPSGSLLIADKLTGSIVRVPISSGALSVASAYQIEKNPHSAQSLFMDAAGDIYSTDVSGKAVYAIARTAASIDFGTVSDGLSLSLPVTLINAGNAPAVLASPAYSAPTNPLFSFGPASGSNGCGSGSGPAGASCEFSATFSPITGSTQQSGTASILFSSPASASATVNLTGLSTTSSILPQTITNFNPATPILAGQQLILTATAGASGNPVTFTIDGTSACSSCATIEGNVLTAVAAGSIIVDADELGGIVGGSQYANAPTVKKGITINSALPTGEAAILMTQQNVFSAEPGGGLDSANWAGSSLVVNQQGNVLVNSGNATVAMYNPSTAAWATLGTYGKYSNGGGVAVDAKGNLYLGAPYGTPIVMIPYNNGTYATWTGELSSASPALPNCTSSSTAPCTVLSSVPGGGGVVAMTMDAAGDLFISTHGFAIVECSAACVASNGSSPAPVVIFQEPAGTTGADGIQLYTGSVAVDPWGNVFFTDSNLIKGNSSNYNAISSFSDLYYLPVSSSSPTGYAATPTLLVTFTNTAPASYGNELDAVVATSNGTIYYATQYDGIYAIPNTKAGGPVVTSQYAISGQGAKIMGLDSKDNIFLVNYANANKADTLEQVIVNDITLPVAQLDGAAVTSAVTVVDNVVSCSKSAVLSIASSDSQFSGSVAAGATCSSITVSSGNGTLTTSTSGTAVPLPAPDVSTYPATLSFSDTTVGLQSATLTTSDTANGGIGTTAVTGLGKSTPQAITFTLPTNATSTYAPGLTITLGATGGGSGNAVVFTVDSASTGIGTIAGSVLSVTQAGSIIIDANQAGGTNAGIHYDAAPQVQFTLTVQPASQALTFLAPLTPVTYAPGLQFALSATPGITGNPIVFSVDSTSTATATISANILTVTGAGNLVIDANEAGNLNYAAAAQQQQTVVVNQATQAITFVPPAVAIHYVPNPVASVCSATNVGVDVNCNQITLVATGGASGKPVVFTVDKASTASATISGTTLTFASVGNVVVDANQVSTTNYLAAPQVQETIAILPALATQTISFTNPGTLVAGTTFTLSATSSSGLPVSYTASPSTVCTVSGSVVTAVASGTCTLTALQPGDNAYFAMAAPVQLAFTVNPAGLIPSMTLSFSMSNLVLQKGSVGVTQLVINSGNNFAGTVTFTCSGAPSGYTCAINPNPVFVPQGGSVATTVSVSPTTAASTDSKHSRPYLPIGTLAVALCFFGLRRRNRLQLLLLSFVVLGALGFVSGCGGSNSKTTVGGQSSTMTVTATSNGTTKSATMTVLVQ